MKKFGLFDHLERTEVPLTELYEGRLKLLAEADAARFFCYHVAEHQATPLGMAPSPGIFLAAAAQRTRQLHLGPLVYLLPLYNPLRLANEIAMLDSMSGGRYEIGVGRGISPFELGYYRVPYYDSREMFEEALAAIAAGLRNDRLTHRGRHYNFDAVPMEVRAHQRPNPPFWYGVSTPESARFAAHHNLHFVGIGPHAMLKQLTMLYLEERAATLAKGGDGGLNLNRHISEPTIGAIRHVYVGTDDREVAAIARPAYRAFYNNITKLWLDHRTSLPMFTPDLEVACKADAAIAGTPSQVRDTVARFFDESGCEYLVLAFAWGNLTEAQYRKSFDLFATQVMPEFKDTRLTAAAD
jgi:alkanesulfonate monooxygenase SsuD/methylene tetrahydromethanopterin reductase-like flavin-dependent oxidoreductase (luciferase family)